MRALPGLESSAIQVKAGDFLRNKAIAMSEERCLYRVDAGGVATVTMNRPEKHNALDGSMIAQLNGCLNRVLRDKARLLLLHAEGANFCAGADLNWMRASAELSPRENREEAERLAEVLLKLYHLPLPVVALVQGAAYGGGIGLLACCDIVLAAENAAFAFTEVRLGLVPAVIGPYVVKAIGERAARRYFLTAETFGAAQAQRLGLVHEIVAVADLARRAEEFVEQLRKGAPAAQSTAKALLDRISGAPINRPLAREMAELIGAVRGGDEGREGVRAFLEKREPAWRREPGDV